MPLLLLFWLSTGLGLSSEKERSMLMPLIEGNRYELRSFDRKGQLESNKAVSIGEIVRQDTDLKLDILTYSLTDTAQPVDTVRTTLTCSQSAERMAMSVLAFLGDPGGGRLRLVVVSKEPLFPSELKNDGKLNSVRMEVKVEEGVFSFFGAGSELLFKDRRLRLVRDGDAVTGYRLTSKLLVRASMLGIRLKQNAYVVEETVDFKRGLVEQNIKKAGGGTIELTLQSTGRKI